MVRRDGITMKPDTMSAAAIVSVEDYLHRTEKPYCEYVDGVLYPKPMPTTLHALAQSMLIVLLRRQGVQALTEVTVRLTATKYLIPDVVAARSLQTPYPTDPVLLCVEILSPEDRAGAHSAGRARPTQTTIAARCVVRDVAERAMLAKCEQYHA
jgi:Uma2 family endonuclease